jgi:hypothetical protein
MSGGTDQNWWQAGFLVPLLGLVLTDQAGNPAALGVLLDK